jgi:hypothetical protein
VLLVSINRFEPYLDDDEKFSPAADKTKVTTIGQYVKDLLGDMNYFGTVLKRIPVKLQRDLSMQVIYSFISVCLLSTHRSLTYHLLCDVV